ncbi:glycerol-3-phosphate acyltransferase [Isobaculum melis]|uniref:Glycerol-3-phosphate acyltransferase n=1 Tax=Isobaculum melis TaxID=142588 RepID=A0A1H9UK79_9LACT|nr:glycerol-3-phosphate acyltransferase [Isobaculum melis]SES09594.1 glycerol-3-phosphate acyltransferase PlsY [Isobaculum melis]
MSLYIVLFIIGSYFLGNINGAYLVTKIKTGQDIRQLGSKNAGARNTGRMIGKTGFVITVIIDAIKTFLPLFLSVYLFGYHDLLLILVGLAVMLGHVWPITLGFHGGRGVVVFLATTLFIAIQSFIPLILIGLLTFSIARNFTIAGSIGMLSIPLSTYFLHQSIILSIGLLILLLFVFYLLSPMFDKVQHAIFNKNSIKKTDKAK